MKKKFSFDEIMNSQDLETIKINFPVLVCDGLTPLQVLKVMKATGVEHVVQESNLNFETDINISESMRRADGLFRSFPLCAIMGVSEPTEEKEKDLTRLSLYLDSVNEKSSVLGRFEEQLKDMGCIPSAVAKLTFVLDELLTNAIYNAPFVDESNSTGGASRLDQDIPIDPNKRPCVFLGSDGHMIVLGCRDFYGTLNIKRYIERIHECFQSGRTSLLRHGSGGAGVGGYMVFSSCTNVYIDVEKKKSTVVCCSFPIEKRLKEIESIPKNLHCAENS